MASRMLRICGIVTNSLRNSQTTNNGIYNLSVNHSYLLKTHVPLVNKVRNKTFFVNKNADELWKGVTSVSNAGRRRGRAKGLARKRDLNKGQIIGIGKIPIQFPGLNTPVFRGRELLEQRKLPEDPERMERLAKIRQSQAKPTRMRPSVLERGWTSISLGGRRIGPPDPLGEDTFDGFETWVLESKLVTTMTGSLGRKSQFNIFVVTGNGNGIAGFGIAKTPTKQSAMKKAKNKAGLRLMHIPRYKEHTVLHDFYTQFGSSKIFVKKMYEGYGLICHRAIKACCEAIGIKDMYAKVEGSDNLQNIIKAFFIGLLRQKSYQQLADEKRLHLVELRPENGNYPVVLASPSTVRKPEEIPSNEILDFDQYIMDGRVVLRKKKLPPFYTKLNSWILKTRKMERVRNHDDTRIKLRAKYGEVRSFLTEKYPEAKPGPRKLHKDNETVD